MVWLLASLFLTEPAPLDMPLAEGYLVERDDGTYRLEDRFRRMDLWTSQTTDGRWQDDDGRVFTLFSLTREAPDEFEEDSVCTRTDFAAASRPLVHGSRRHERPLAARELAGTISMLAPVAIDAVDPESPRHRLRGFAEIAYWQGTNRTAIVCAFRMEKSVYWQLATWVLAEGDAYDDRLKLFEEEFLSKEVHGYLREKAARPQADPVTESDRLRADARHSVAAYPTWRVTDAKEFSVLDELPAGCRFVSTLTNELAKMRRRYAEVLPTPVDVTNTLCVARIYGSRDEYLDVLGLNGHGDMEWSAAYWSAFRREIVAYLPEDGAGELLKTFRHEAFHQYLSYATAMIATSPWLNEGYAQYFEDETDNLTARLELDVEDGAKRLPWLFLQDYHGFYDDDPYVRTVNYRLAWSIAVFLEQGAAEVRFQPFAKLKDDYLRTLAETQSMRKATMAAFGTSDNLKLFVDEWTKFWKNR